MDENQPNMLTLMSDSPAKVKEMITDDKVALRCWICGRKQKEIFWGLPSQQKEKGLLLDTTIAREFKTKITTYPLNTKSHGIVNVSACQTCRFLIPEIVQDNQLHKEKKDNKKINSEENNKDQLYFV